MKLKHILLSAIAVTAIGFVDAKNADAASYQINDEFNLGAYEGTFTTCSAKCSCIGMRQQTKQQQERNEATFMKRNWMNAYTTTSLAMAELFIVLVSKATFLMALVTSMVMHLFKLNYNTLHDKNLFAKNYKAYVEYARDSAKRFNIPLTLDQGNTVNDRGIKSHLWILIISWVTTLTHMAT